MAAQPPQVKLPRTITVSGLTWKVRVRAGLRHQGQVVNALYLPDKQEIHLDRGELVTVECARKTLLHEAAHAALTSFPQYCYDENLVSLIEEKIDELIRTNPDFMEMYGYARLD